MQKHDWIYEFEKIQKKSPIKRVRKFKRCDEPGCGASVTRLDTHKKRKHKADLLMKAEEKFKNLLITSYVDWQKSSDSGGLTAISIDLQTRNVKRMYDEEELAGFTGILDEFCVSRLVTRKRESGAWESSSAATYLFSLINFYKYLTTSFFKTIYEANKLVFRLPLEVIKERAVNMTSSAGRWARTHNKKATLLKDEKYEKDRENILTKEESKVIKYGTVYKNVR